MGEPVRVFIWPGCLHIPHDAALAVVNKQRLSRWILAGHYGLVAVVYAAAAASHQMSGSGREAAAIWMIVPEHVVFSVGLSTFEGR